MNKVALKGFAAFTKGNGKKLVYKSNKYIFIAMIFVALFEVPSVYSIPS